MKSHSIEMPARARDTHNNNLIFHNDLGLGLLIGFLDVKDLAPLPAVSITTLLIYQRLNASQRFNSHSGVDKKILHSIQQDAKKILNQNAILTNGELKTALEHVAAGTSTVAERQLVASQPVEFKSGVQETCTSVAEFSLNCATWMAENSDDMRNACGSSKKVTDLELLFYAVSLSLSAVSYVSGSIWGFFENYNKKDSQERIKKRVKFLDDREREAKESEEKKPPGGPAIQ